MKNILNPVHKKTVLNCGLRTATGFGRVATQNRAAAVLRKIAAQRFPQTVELVRFVLGCRKASPWAKRCRIA
jgi:hypothetical protein